MRTLLLISLLIVGGNASASCIFGDDLVETARMKDLNVSSDKTISEKSKVSRITKQHIVTGMEAYSFPEALEMTDDGKFWVHSVEDTTHAGDYLMYIYSAGDNINGFFVDVETNDIVAKVGDGSIHSCIVDFENYDKLDWFYTN